MSCGLKITQTNGTSLFITESFLTSITLAAGVAGKPFQITDCAYQTIVAGVLTNNNAAAIPAYTGANVLYEYGDLADVSTFRVIAHNRT